jgi:Zn-dependent protease with chaperone function
MSPQLTQIELLVSIRTVFYWVKNLAGSPRAVDANLFISTEAPANSLAGDVPIAFATGPDSPYTDHSPFPGIVMNLGLCTAVHSRDELAFAFAHELAHIDHGDYEKLKRTRDRLWAVWIGKQAPLPAAWEFIPGLAYAKFQRDTFWQMAPVERPMEDAADRTAVETLSKPDSPFKPIKGSDLMAHFKDADWGLGFDEYPLPTTHSTYPQRSDNVQNWTKLEEMKHQFEAMK